MHINQWTYGKAENFRHHHIGMSSLEGGVAMRGSIWKLIKIGVQSTYELVTLMR